MEINADKEAAYDMLTGGYTKHLRTELTIMNYYLSRKDKETDHLKDIIEGEVFPLLNYLLEEGKTSSLASLARVAEIRTIILRSFSEFGRDYHRHSRDVADAYRKNPDYVGVFYL